MTAPFRFWARIGRPCRNRAASPWPTFRPLLDALEARCVPAVYRVSDGAALAAAVQAADAKPSTPSVIILEKAGTYSLPASLHIGANLTITAARMNQASSYIITPASGVSDRVIDVTGKHTLTLVGLTIAGGSATSGDGGGIDMESAGDRLVMSDVVVRNNSSSSDGGGVAMADGAVLTLVNCAIMNNTAANDGGGVYFTASSQAAAVTAVGTSFDANQAGTKAGAGDGGGMIVQAMRTSGAGSGSALPRVAVTLVRDSFTNNTSQNDGGGVWDNDVTAFTAVGVIASNNTSVQDAGGIGDSVKDLNGAAFTLVSSTIMGNQVTGPGTGVTPDGGGVCFDFQAAGSTTPTGTVSAVMAGNVLSGNTVAGAGGGMFLRDEASETHFVATVAGNRFADNQATSSNISSDENGDGGGMYLAASARTNVVALVGDAFIDNTADADGGGLTLRIDSGIASIIACSFTGNQASNNGGGLFLTGDSSTGKGGTVNVLFSRIDSNQAGADGGGLFLDSSATARLWADIITGNSATMAGGGIRNNDGSLSVGASRVSNNQALLGPDISGPYTNRGGNHIG